MDRWNLDVLYTGYQDPAYQSDIQALESSVAEMNALSLSHEDELATLTAILKAQEKVTALFYKLLIYTQLRQSVDTTNEETTNYLGKLQALLSETSRAQADIEQFIAKVEDLDALLEKDELLAAYRFRLKEIKAQAKYTLSAQVEEVIAKMNLSAGRAWADMQQYMTSTLTVSYRGEEIPLAQARNLAYNEDQKVRKDAYEAECAAYEKIKDGVCYSLNNLKKQVNTLTTLRGGESALQMTLLQSRMSQKTLDAMLTALKENLPHFWAYLKRKAHLLGYEGGLKWYDLFAPMGKDQAHFTPEEAKDYLVEHFKPFSEELSEMVARAFAQNWIDFFPREGKVGGAFCEIIPQKNESRVLTNFDGAFGDVVTLAHELGHAFHNQQIQDHRILNLDYSMPVAETASTFNETLIMNDALATADKETVIALLENQLQDTTQIICDIYSRFLFESEVFDKTKEAFLFPDTLCEIMRKAQKTAYGDGLDENCLHPYMWVCKSHYYSEGLSFYNFPYAFGGLFATGLYAKYQKEGASFLPKYKALLHATPVASVEEAAKMVGIDLETPDFWRESFAIYKDRIDKFLELTK